ncbi:hypothetical protein BDQ17DRAFT_1324641 [Cyathus striatus]|nr:hypothetical protein BDQ17DRAFT_1324641 [Cyathus striatus]
MVNTADSVSIFAEGTFEEQIQELVVYIARNRSEEERTAFIAPFQAAVTTKDGQKPFDQDEERRKKVFGMVLAEVTALGEGNDKEAEGFFNLVFAHLLNLYSPESSEANEYVQSLLTTLSTPSPNRLSITYRILYCNRLSNLFNVIPRASPLRLAVYRTLLSLATANDNLAALQIEQDEVKKWLSEWNIPEEEKAAFLKSLPMRMQQLAKSLPASSSEAKSAAVDLIATALRLPNIFDFDPLFKLDAIIAVKDNELFSLLQIFLNSELPEFRAWIQSHPTVAEKYNLDVTQLERKIRLLTLASLGFKHVGLNLSYTDIAEALQVEPSDVEKWVIDVIRAGLLWGKLSQTAQSLHISRATPRTFEREQWEILEKRLLAWKSGLAGVLDVVANAKRLTGHLPAQQPQQLAPATA